MIRKDNHYDKAQAESLFSRFKVESLDGGLFYGFEDALSRTLNILANITIRYVDILRLAILARWVLRSVLGSSKSKCGYFKSTAKTSCFRLNCQRYINGVVSSLPLTKSSKILGSGL